MKTRVQLTAASLCLLFAVPILAQVINVKITPSTPATDPKPTTDARPDVDLVICLDTSGSMTQLIDSARARLWDIVNELARATPMPRLRVGLLTYGSPGISTPAQGWVVRQTDLTDDLDTVYAKMMGMTTNGGDEFVGWVLRDALQMMSWSSQPGALKLIFVAGNESADQAADQVNFRQVCKSARERGITINAIYAGNHAAGITEHWDQVGMHGGGSFAAIDMQAGTVQITTPQDRVLLELNIKLNDTYVPYGKRGDEGRQNQLAQDKNADKVGAASASSRVAAKGTRLYTNAYWDLVDADDDEAFNLAELESADLPEEMQAMTVPQRQAYIDGMKNARRAVRRQIQEVSAARDTLVKKERARRAGGKTSLDEALLDALRKQAEAKGFRFEK